MYSPCQVLNFCVEFNEQLRSMRSLKKLSLAVNVSSVSCLTIRSRYISPHAQVFVHLQISILSVATFFFFGIAHWVTYNSVSYHRFISHELFVHRLRSVEKINCNYESEHAFFSTYCKRFFISRSTYRSEFRTVESTFRNNISCLIFSIIY